MMCAMVNPHDIPHAKQVTNAYICQGEQPATSHSLDHPPGEEHFDARAQCGDQRSDEEDRIGQQEYRFATPNITELAPDWRCRSCCQKIRGSNPCVVGLRGIVMSRYGRHRRRDDGLSAISFTLQWAAMQLTVSSAARKTAIWTSALALCRKLGPD